MNRTCQLVFRIFAGLYLLALALFLIGAFGLFGSEADPVGAVFLIPLGLPWNRLIDGFPEPAWPWLVAVAPVLNLLVIGLICRIARAARG